jgi:hypothetical protein
MDAENQVEDFVTDATVNTSASEPPPEHPAVLDRQELRRKRIDDYRDEGLALPVAGEACVAVVKADLFDITSGLGEVIRQSLAEGPPTLETVGQLEPALNSYYRGTRQLDRLLQFAAKLAAARTRADETKLQLQLLALKGPLNDAAGP